MKITKVSQTPVNETPHFVDVRLLYDKETAQAVHIQLQPGEGLKPHITPVDVFFYVLEGTAEIMVGKEKQNVEKDCLVESPENVPHTITNRSDAQVRILVVKAPKPTSMSKIL